MSWRPWIFVFALTHLGCGSGPSHDAADTSASSGGGSAATTVAGNSASSDNGAAKAGDDTGGSASTSTGSGSSGTPLGATRSGEGTYYAADGSGACLFDASPDDLDVAALNAKDWDGSAYCGACAAVDGPDGSVTVRIVDLCPECASGDLDLSPQAFEQIAALEQGRVPISWSFVACDVSGPVAYRYKDGTNQWWTAVQVLNHKLPIVSLEWSADGQNFNPTQRQDYNYFLDENGFGDNPVTVRITASDGQVLMDELPAPQELLVVDGQAQFD